MNFESLNSLIYLGMLIHITIEQLDETLECKQTQNIKTSQKLRKLPVTSYLESQVKMLVLSVLSVPSVPPVPSEHVTKKLSSSKKFTYRPPLVTAMASLHMNNQELSHESSLQSGTCQSLCSPENRVFYNFGF